ncbi:hypothetical protein [Rhodococcus sp. SORGH_AS_0303]|uniref:hypothetical protein n=1 Tax=Rhodococcus sp. SORGH_AS_0303 TaxID=3041753 RepID=UPI002786C7D8|nr:hypothetical protein [Rhodococcus sp. SORGH_AS_0303]MDQ1201080.1 hypothetical protein [Rhodococcus sp. SORGH_AS_0303]
MPAKGVRLAHSPTTKNAPDAGQGIEGSDQRTLSKEKNLMNDMVDQTTHDAPIDLDADLTEFEQYAREYFPKVSPKSPYYRAEERAYEYSTWVPHNKVHEEVAPGVTTPVWHHEDSADESWRPTPYSNGFVSGTHLVRISSELGATDVEGITFPSFAARIIQGFNMREPVMETWVSCVGSEGGGDSTAMKWLHKSRMRLTLDEAAEVAKLLLLLVDVARDTTVQGGE